MFCAGVVVCTKGFLMLDIDNRVVFHNLPSSETHVLKVVY
jgi:hypothetical protein